MKSSREDLDRKNKIKDKEIGIEKQSRKKAAKCSQNWKQKETKMMQRWSWCERRWGGGRGGGKEGKRTCKSTEPGKNKRKSVGCVFLRCMSHRQILLWLKWRFCSRPLLTYSYLLHAHTHAKRHAHAYTCTRVYNVSVIFVKTFFHFIRTNWGSSLFSVDVMKSVLNH